MGLLLLILLAVFFIVYAVKTKDKPTGDFTHDSYVHEHKKEMDAFHYGWVAFWVVVILLALASA